MVRLTCGCTAKGDECRDCGKVFCLFHLKGGDMCHGCSVKYIKPRLKREDKFFLGRPVVS